MKKNIHAFFAIAILLIAFPSYAYDRKACFDAISSNPQYLGQVNNLELKVSNRVLTLLSEGIDADFTPANSISMAIINLQSTANSIEVIIALRQAGSFKNQVAVDKLVNLHMSAYYKSLLNSTKNIARLQNLVKNTSLKNDITEIIIELSRIAERLKSCESD
jgi:hypothetical protein